MEPAAAQGPADGRPFSVLAVSPADQAVRIAPKSPISPVALAFSAPLDPASITPGNFSLFAGDEVLDPEIRYSADFRTVTLSAPAAAGCIHSGPGLGSSAGSLGPSIARLPKRVPHGQDVPLGKS